MRTNPELAATETINERNRAERGTCYVRNMDAFSTFTGDLSACNFHRGRRQCPLNVGDQKSKSQVLNYQLLPAFDRRAVAVSRSSTTLSCSGPYRSSPPPNQAHLICAELQHNPALIWVTSPAFDSRAINQPKTKRLKATVVAVFHDLILITAESCNRHS